MFSGTFKTLLKVHEAPQDGKLVFSLIKSAFMKDFVGQWQVGESCQQVGPSVMVHIGLPGATCLMAYPAHLADYVNTVQFCPCCLGQASSLGRRYCIVSLQLQGLPGGGCQVQHTLKVEPILDTPALFSGYTKNIFVQQVTKILEDLDKELKRL